MSESIKPYRIDIPQSELDELRERLQRTRWPDAETPDDWSQGMPLAYCREMVDYWIGQYDWRRIESKMNGWEQFTTEIDGVEVLFLERDFVHLGFEHGILHQFGGNELPQFQGGDLQNLEALLHLRGNRLLLVQPDFRRLHESLLGHLSA